MIIRLGHSQMSALRSINDERVAEAVAGGDPGSRSVSMPYIAWTQVLNLAVERSFNRHGRTTKISRANGFASLTKAVAAGLTKRLALTREAFTLDSRSPAHVAFVVSPGALAPEPDGPGAMIVARLPVPSKRTLDFGGGPVKLNVLEWAVTRGPMARHA